MFLSKIYRLFCCRNKFKTVFFHDSGYLTLQDRQLYRSEENEKQERGPKIRKVCSWNIQELFVYHSSLKLTNILYHINCLDAEVLCLQEVFEPAIIRAIIHNKTIRDKYPYFLSGDMKNKYIIGENSGLFVLSQFPIRFIDFKYLPHAICPDNFATKGVLYFCVGNLSFALTHLQSGSPNIAQRQLQFVMDQSPFKKNFIVLGDFNLTNANILLDVERNNTVITHNSQRIIDYILPISCSFHINNDVLQIDLDNVSDHYPIIGTIIYDGKKGNKIVGNKIVGKNKVLN